MVEIRHIPESISETYYLLNRGWLFQMVMFVVGFSLMPVWLEISSDAYKFLVFISCASICFIGAAPALKIKFESQIHYTCAVLCGACSFAWQILEGMWDTQLFFGFLGLCGIIKQPKNYTWWIEIAIIFSLFANLIREILI